ncbi:MAG: acetyl-CoA carboxylase biotin carboxyl carrier protein [Chitinophagaceae bacterium]|nr:acetyl-CoA carboxylase biotin carboxyl carrier protein [Chitinophagaceae bacterium]
MEEHTVKDTKIVLQESAKVEEIAYLIDLISKKDLEEVEIQTTYCWIKTKKTARQEVIPAYQPVMPSPVSHIGTPQIVNSLPITEDIPKKKTGEPSTGNTHSIRSPFIGTFYTSSAPGKPPYVSEGDKISAKQKVCTIEAMKTFNELESDVSGTIIKICVQNGTSVEFDQELFVVDVS